MWNAPSPTTAFKKKLYKFRPGSGKEADARVETHYSRSRVRLEHCDSQSLERGVRQMLADKVSGHLLGLWLLVAEHLRLGTWDLLRAWTGQPGHHVEPRLAMQLVHEAALCLTGIRDQRTLASRGGFELVNGLPFVASDTAIHDLLANRSVSAALRLQVMLGKIRRTVGDFQGKVLAIDPHRVRSHSKRHMRKHAKAKASARPMKTAQTFWLLDADTHQPLCFTTASAARTVAQALPEMLDTAAEILVPQTESALVLADTEYFNAELIDHVAAKQEFELIVAMSNTPSIRRQLEAIAPDQFTPRWAGFATMKRPYHMKRGEGPSCYQYVQRSGERPEEWNYKAFLSTSDGDEVDAITLEFPKRWHVEEFFNTDQALGWNRAGTMNLNIRYGQMTMGLVAQAVIHQLRNRLGETVASWDARHLAKDLFQALDGDVRVKHDTIIVTYYNAPDAELLRTHFENLPDRLTREQFDPRVPWLCNFKLDFRFL